jgi:multiple sugar transport system substrate-binding protein
MKKLALRTTIAVGVSIGLLAAATGCTATPAAQTGPVTITVAGKPSADQTAAVKVFDQTVADFSKANPKIKVKTSEYGWEAQTFQATLAGGTLPTVFNVPNTEIQSLIANKQAADVTDALSAIGLAKDLNPGTLSIAEDSSKKVYGIPTASYAIGLIYNRDLFTKAGLDPNKPPTTWAEVRTDAKKIADATGVSGYSQMSSDNTGGWMLTAMSSTYGGSMENAAGTKTTFTSGATQKALEQLKKMRWDDNSMGSQFLYTQQTILQDFAADKIGMLIGAPIGYNFAVDLFKANKTHFGMGAIPQSGSGSSTLIGGLVNVLKPDATEAQKQAGLKWIEFSQLRQFTNKAAALTLAKTTVAGGLSIGVPGITPLTQKNYNQFLGWIKSYVNVPTENFSTYTASLTKAKYVPEPRSQAQELYGLLDPVVQAVLTDKNANIKQLLATAATTMDAKLGR